MAVCQVCQHANPEGAEFCEECGAALAPAPGQETQGAATPAAPASTGVTPSTRAGAGEAAPGTAAAGTGDAAASAGAGGGEAASSSPGGVSATAATPQGSGGVPEMLPERGPMEEAPPTAAPSDGAAAEPAAPVGAATIPATGAPPAAPTPPTAGARPRLVAVRYGALTGEEIPLLGERLVIGRFDPETGPVDIDLSSAPEAGHISRQHGELYREADGRWVVRDLGSTNGIFVKGGSDPSFGPRITAPRPLSDGDELAFGNARFVFRTA